MKRTNVIVLAASKGGVGKTTLSAALAVRASQEAKRVGFFDTDFQRSLEMWWGLRGQTDNPKLIGLDCSQEGLELLISEGWDWIFIDTPPALMDRIEQAIVCADLVLIPTGASMLDLTALRPVIEICTALQKPYAFVLNKVETDAKLTSTAAKALESAGSLMKARVTYRRPYISAMTVGKSGPEVERGSGCATEIEALWQELKATLEHNA